MRARFFDFSDRIAQESRLFISGLVSPGDTSIAIGPIVLPDKPGDYRLMLDFVCDGISEFPRTDDQAGQGFETTLSVQ